MNADWLQHALARQRRASFAAALVGAVGCVWGAATDYEAFLRSYLLAYLFWWSAALGCLGGLMIYYLTGGAWGRAARPFLESGALTLPLIGLAFVPVALELDQLYPWARPAETSPTASATHAARQPTAVGPTALTPAAEAPSVEATAAPVADDVRAYYLNPRAFYIRAAGYFAVWLLLMAVLCRRAPEATDRPDWTRRVSALGAVVLVLTCTFAAIDWGMSLESDWYSTMYGALVVIGGLLAAFALATTAASYLQAASPPEAELMPADTLADFGSLLLSFLMLWAYFAFSQFLIIWSGNLPEENVWYVHRITGGWQWFALLVIACQFVIPFLLLLSRDLKRNPRWLGRVAMLIMALQFIFTLWTILPAFCPGAMSLHLTDVAAPLAFGGIWLWCYASILPRRLVLPLVTEASR